MIRNHSAPSPPETDAPLGRVLVVDDHRQARESMVDVLRRAGHRVECCGSAAEALQVLTRDCYDCVVTDLKMPGMSGLEFIVEIEARRYRAQIVMVTAHASVASAVEAMRHGAFDYIEKPFDVDQLEYLTGQAIRHGRLVATGSTPSESAGEPSDGTDRGAAANLPPMIGSSEPMQSLRARIAQIGPTPETVLITGESGTGKELVARAVHAHSDRRDAPLVSLNCPVLSAHLMESELFGHERGAFTGADAARTGRFEMADNGSILLDEVTEIDLNLQAKLLRVLQERSFERVGSSETLCVDVRVLATTNRDLRDAVDDGEFRKDLYYRLAVVPLHVPPLRERHEDIAELTDYFFRRSAERLQKEPCTLEPAARQLLIEYHWPGNVRELENIVTRASVLNLGEPVAADQLRRWLIADSRDAASGRMSVGLSLREMERKLIEATLEHFDGHRAKTAKALGIGIRTIWKTAAIRIRSPRKTLRQDTTAGRITSKNENPKRRVANRQNLPVADAQNLPVEPTHENVQQKPNATETNPKNRPRNNLGKLGRSARCPWHAACKRLCPRRPKSHCQGQRHAIELIPIDHDPHVAGDGQLCASPTFRTGRQYRQPGHTRLQGPGPFAGGFSGAVAGGHRAEQEAGRLSQPRRRDGREAERRRVGRNRQEPQGYSVPRQEQRRNRVPSYRNGQEPDAAQHGPVDYGQPVSPAPGSHFRESVEGGLRVES